MRTEVDLPSRTAGRADRPTDRYREGAGVAHLTGIQALARMPIEQARRDVSAGRDIGTYISGYEGSPLAGYDLELLRQLRLLQEHRITFEPALNEEFAATAVQGSQLIDSLRTTVEAVVGFWYGKAPGLDRASDALRHANLMGTHPRGGAVALVGDDPAAKSSSLPCASERTLADLFMPTFYPSDPADILRLGRHAVALSRACGLWSAMKIVTAVADGSATVTLDGDGPELVAPRGSGTHQPTAKLLQPTLGPLERDQATHRLRIAREYLALNRLNPVVQQHADDAVGIIAGGKTYLDVREALGRVGHLGTGAGTGTGTGVRLMKLDVVWPLDAEQIRAFAQGLDEIVVVEEKRPFVEMSVRDALYRTPQAPEVVGANDRDGRELLAVHGELDADQVTVALARRLVDTIDSAGAARWLAERSERLERQRLTLPVITRAPYFCSGCPHNTSARVAESPVGAGIGCHAMVLLMDDQQVGNVLGLTQMGGEGTQWLGMAPFVKEPHLVQNIGDGTFHHSGSLAVRAAVAAGRNITFRLLRNGTVAMTGGQEVVGGRALNDTVRGLLAEGVARVIVTSDDPRGLRRAGLPRGVQVWDRTRVDEAQRVLAAVPGTTVLIHDQECATELRRKRTRGLAPQPPERVVINERLCEGCGDCGAKSNCLSVHPVATEFGQKTAIHQSSCNADLTCLAGDCPAFMTVRGGAPASTRRAEPIEAESLPDPVTRVGRDVNVRLVGIGGTGVVTTSQVLALAAVLSGRYVQTLDQTGLAQKGGAVISDIRISALPPTGSNRIGEAECDLYLGLDPVSASAPVTLGVVSARTTAVVSTSIVPTGAMVSCREVALPEPEELVAAVRERAAATSALDLLNLVSTLFGTEQVANIFAVGVAYQSGVLSVPAEAIEEAIALNDVAVETNLQAFRQGRRWVCDRAAVEADLRKDIPPAPPEPSTIVRAGSGSELERLVAIRRAELTAYQDARLARRYEGLVEQARIAEERAVPGSTRFAESVARGAFHLMAYKDEYEVARLVLLPQARDAVVRQFGADSTVSWKLHPPILRAMGVQRKLSVGAWFTPAFVALRSARRLRGTPFDVFGWARVRRVERRLAAEYETTVRDVAGRLSAQNLAIAVEVAELANTVRGYEGVKLRAVEKYDVRRVELLAELS